MPTNCTIAVNKDFREKLKGMKKYERETYEDVIIRLINENAAHKRSKKQIQKDKADIE